MFRRRRSPLRIIIPLLLLIAVVVGGVFAWAGAIPGVSVSVPFLPAGQVGGLQPGRAQTATATPTPTPKPLTEEELAKQAVTKFFDAWDRRDYAAMYRFLSGQAKTAITQEKFVNRYRAITTGVAAMKIGSQVSTTTLTPSQSEPTQATVAYVTTIQTARVGQIEEQNNTTLAREGGQWLVNWTPDLIFKGLTTEGRVLVDTDDPTRGSILDRKGRTLAGPGKVLAVGVVPGNIKDASRAAAALSALLGIPVDQVRAKYAGAQADWWVPLRDFPESRKADIQARIAGIAGVEAREKVFRVYPLAEAAAHVVGYVNKPTADELAKLAPEGYEEDDMVGRSGIEAWAETELAGKKGGRVLVLDAAGNTVRVVAERKAVEGINVQLALDIDIQQQAEKSLGDKTGSIVVMDPRDNSVLAMASRPAFDPNAFLLGMAQADFQQMLNDPRHPFQNRAVAGSYPTGSIFKVITMDAGLEKGGFTPDSPFDCNGTWTGLPGVTMGDWKPEGHGRLDLTEGLTESCDIVFYELGKKLDAIDSNLLPDFARQFGLGDVTGLVGLDEVKGVVPDPAWKQDSLREPWYAGDAINLAIGQGFLQATPIQMANVYATLANGGEVRTPVLVQKVGDGVGAKEFKYQAKHRITASPATLAAIREGMKRVASSAKGTAYYAFQNFQVPTAAKTGSAENETANAHAWFAGYAPVDNPEVVVLVLVEGGNMGGEV
ncbi:MAG: penicillin-binding protein 2, partial [Chloroflexota bacterium]